jgi:hypothetical protein
MMGTHLLQSILASCSSELAASFFKNITKMLAWRDFYDSSSGCRVYYHHVRGHVLVTFLDDVAF